MSNKAFSNTKRTSIVDMLWLVKGFFNLISPIADKANPKIRSIYTIPALVNSGIFRSRSVSIRLG